MPQRTEGEASTGRAGGAPRIVAVASGKGGVGKSTVAAALAVELASRGLRVGLLDCDLAGPSIPTLFGRPEAQMDTDANGHITPLRLSDNLELVSFGFLLGDAPAIMRGPMLSRYISQLLQEVTWNSVDWLVYDLPPGTGDIHLTITQTVSIDGALIVSSPHLLSYADVGRAILMFETVKVPVVGIVENMAWFDCNHCGERHNLFGQQASQLLSQRFGLPIIGSFPLIPTLYEPPFLEPQALRALTDRLLAQLGQQAPAIYPSIAVDDQHLQLRWEDGRQLRVSHRRLRAACQCALCVDERSGHKRLRRATIPDNVHPLQWRTLGNYALYIEWSDGHSTGFFPYDLIQRVGDEGEAGDITDETEKGMANEREEEKSSDG